MRTRHDKLIRDRIPEIMDAAGIHYEVAELSEEAYQRALLAKVREEAREVADSENAEELTREIADLYEVLNALIEQAGITLEQVQEVKGRRREERGGFERRLELLWTDAGSGSRDG